MDGPLGRLAHSLPGYLLHCLHLKEINRSMFYPHGLLGKQILLRMAAFRPKSLRHGNETLQKRSKAVLKS